MNCRFERDRSPQAGPFTFVINSTTVKMSASDAVTLSPAVVLVSSVFVEEDEVNAQ
jgi:hypothetical protein